jgi:Family of unknown function (DUF6152)
MRHKVLASVLVLLVVAATAPARAHHATQAEFDKNKLKTITGVMTKVLWVNPHVNWIMDVKEPNGKVTTWTLVGAGPGAFRAAGLSGRDFFKTGETYTATIALAHNGSARGHIMTFKMPDGKLVTLWKGDFNDPLGR